MPKKAVVEFECDRCGRKWYGEGNVNATPALQLVLMNAEGDVLEQADYQVLCDSCSTACMNYAGSITKEMKKSSPKRVAKEEGTEAPPSPVPPPAVRAR